MVTYDDIASAAERIRGVAHRTPVATSRLLDAACGNRMFLKCENLQRVGAFKFRGAYNAVSRLSDDERGAGRHHPLVGQPRPGAGAGVPAPGRACHHRHAAGCAAAEAGRHARLRRRGRDLRSAERARARRSRTSWPPSTATS